AAAARPDRIGRPLVPALTDAVRDAADRTGGPPGGLPDLRVLRRGLARLHRPRAGRGHVHRARQDAAGVDREPAPRPLRHRDRPARDPARPGSPEAAPGHPDQPAVVLMTASASMTASLSATAS